MKDELIALAKEADTAKSLKLYQRLTASLNASPTLLQQRNKKTALEHAAAAIRAMKP